MNLPSISQIKDTVIEALKVEYGFAPHKKDIILLEASYDRTYIMFEVRSKQYQFNSYDTGFGIWCGEGTISRYFD